MHHQDMNTGGGRPEAPTSAPHHAPAARLEPHHRPVADRFGPYRLVAPLAPSRVADRWLAIDDRQQANHTVHRLTSRWPRSERRRAVLALQRTAAVAHLHILPVQSYTLVEHAGEGEVWIVTPYTGSQSGLLTLEHLPSLKGGRLSQPETIRGIRHLLEACAAAHRAGVVHGPMSPDEILVDRHGSLLIEFYGLRLAMQSRGAAPDPELIRDEIRSVTAMAYRLLTGMPADEPRIRAGRLVKKLDREFDDWLEQGLDAAGGFDSADEALDALPGVPAPAPRRTGPVAPGVVNPVRGVFSRLRPVAPPDESR